MKKVGSIFLALWLYAGWFGCVLLGRSGWGVMTTIFPIVAWIVFVVDSRPNARTCLKLVGLAITGIIFDSIISALGGLQFIPPPTIGLLPTWMISLWLLFAISLVLLRQAFQKRYAVASLVGAVSGPVTYLSGSRFGVLEVKGPEFIAIYVAFWTIYLPAALYWLNQDWLNQENPTDRK